MKAAKLAVVHTVHSFNKLLEITSYIPVMSDHLPDILSEAYFHMTILVLVCVHLTDLNVISRCRFRGGVFLKIPFRLDLKIENS